MPAEILFTQSTEQEPINVTLIGLFQNIATMLTSTLGIAMITVAIAGCAIGAAFHMLRWSHVFEAIGAGAIAFSAAWIVNTYLAG